MKIVLKVNLTEIPTWVSDGYVVYKLLPRALYLPDFAPSDFLLFPNLKKWVTGKNLLQIWRPLLRQMLVLPS